MKIETLLSREPFGEILGKTLTRFFSEKDNINVQVKWIDSYREKKLLVKQGYSTWVCNSKVNSIFPKHAKKEVYEIIRKEYSYAENEPLLKNILRKGYLQIATGIASEKLATNFVGFSRPVQNQEGMLIIAGNNKIRIIDNVTNKAYVILKDQFDKKYLNRETEIRLMYNNLPIPKLIGDYRDKGYIIEEIISGTSINRLRSKESGILYVNQAFHNMIELYQDSMTLFDLNTYLDQLYQRIVNHLSGIRFLNEQDKGLVKRFSRLLIEYVHIHFENAHLFIAQTHGDFQDGNILVQENETISIIDWECSIPRSLFYDAFVYHLKSRKPSGISKRLVEIRSSLFSIGLSQLIYSSFPDAINKEKMNLYIAIFFLEDLLFYLEENDNSYSLGLGDSLCEYINELPELSKILITDI